MMKNINTDPSYVDKIIEILSDPANAIGIFEELNIGQFDKIQSTHKYQRKEGRKGLVLNLEEKGQKSNSKKIFVDIKEGLPSTEQLHEVIYGAGHECYIRLIIFSTLKNEQENEDPTADFNVIKDIIETKNQYGLNIYLMNFFEPLPDDEYHHYFIYTAPRERPKYSLDDIETELQFREGEFWICIVNSLDKDLYSNWPSPDRRFDGLGHHVDVGNARVKIAWNEQGSKIPVYQTDGKNDLLRDMWKTKKSDLRKLFKGRDVNLEHLGEKLQMMTVNISEVPVAWLLKAELHEKLELAEHFHRNCLKMIGFVKDVTKAAERDR